MDEDGAAERPKQRAHRFASHALVCTLLLYAALRTVAPVAEGDEAHGALRELAAVAQAALLVAIAAGLALLAARVSRRDVSAAALWGLTGFLGCGAYIDSRFLVFFGRHAYHPATLELLLSPGSSDHSGVSVGQASLWVLSWLVGTIAFTALGRALRARPLAPPWLAWPLIALLVLDVAHAETSTRAPSLDRFQSNLFLRGLTIGRAPHAIADAETPYPLGPLGPAATGDRPDLLLVIIESLRSDALEPETMPELSRWSGDDAFVATRHYAGANCTANSFFTLLYGTNGTTFVRFTDLEHPVPSAPLAWLRESGYTLGFYTSQRLHWRHMGDLFVRPAFDVVVEETEGEVWERDARLADRYLADHVDGQPRFSVIFFTASHHDYSFPEDRAPFQPSLRPLDVMATDLRPYRTELANRYRNSVSYVDSLVGELLDRLEASGRLDTTRVIITGDHGEELLEHGHLTHASSLVEEQIHVPLIALGVPGLTGRSEVLTSHEQIVPTLIASIAPDLAFANVGTGLPMLDGESTPLVSECADVPGQFVAIEPSQKDWITVEPSSIRLDFVTDVHDAIIEGGAAGDETFASVRAAVEHFGGEHSFSGQLWPCPSIVAGGETFYICDRWIAWTEASELCASHGLALASFVDEAQNDEVARAATSETDLRVWLGLTDTETSEYRWEDGSAPSFTRWEDESPSARAHCAQVDAAGHWTHHVCDERERFVCGPRRETH